MYEPKELQSLAFAGGFENLPNPSNFDSPYDRHDDSWQYHYQPLDCVRPHDCFEAALYTNRTA